MTDRTTIIGAAPVVRAVDCPEWGGRVHVRVMSGRQRDRFDEIVSSKSMLVGLRALVAAFTLCDEKGALLFEESDIPELEGADANALTRVLMEAMKLNRLRDEDFEELQGNSPGGPSAAPGSDLQNGSARLSESSRTA